MNQRLCGLLTAGAVVAFSGCTGTQGGLFSNVNGSRIAPPATGSIQYSRTATLPDPYYNSNNSTPGIQLPPPPPGGVPATVNTSQGWRPAGMPPNASSPTTYNLPATTPVVQIPPNNMTVASSTSALGAGSNLQMAQASTGVLAGYEGSTATAATAAGGMRLNDATSLQVGVPPPQVANTGLLNRSWEYVVRPGTPQMAQAAWPNGPNPNQPNLTYPGQYMVGPGNAVPPPYNAPGPNYPNAPYANPYTYPQGIIADGWRQRDANGAIPR